MTTANPAVGSPKETADAQLYGAPFWLTYVANACFVSANTLLARYVEFVRLHEATETEWYVGWIVGLGMLGSVAVRLLLGKTIDRYGPRRIWLLCGVLFAASCVAHLAITRVDTPLVFGVRLLMAASLAGVFGASMVYISRLAPPARMAEMIGTLGTSGFVGMFLGPILGDVIFQTETVYAWQVQAMFLGAAGLGVLSVVFAALATRGELPPVHRRRQPAVLGLLWKYFPGSILLVGLMMGVGLAMPNVFLADFTKQLGIPSIWTFFTIYALTAFITRVTIRRFPEKYGIKPTALIGLCSLVLCYLLMLPVQHQWQLVIPALAMGFAHAFLFPAVVAGGSQYFPERHRGVGTSVMLMMLDTGILVGSPLVGGLLQLAKSLGLPAYPVAFSTVVLLIASIAVTYAVLGKEPAAKPSRQKVFRRKPSEIAVASRLEQIERAECSESFQPKA